MKNLMVVCILVSISIAACAMDDPCIEHAGECHSDEATAEVDTPNLPESTCEDGWHYHWTTWPATAFYQGGSNDCNLSNPWSAGSGTAVCMKNQPAIFCNGQGYAVVKATGTVGFRPEFRARMESFNGH